MSELPRYQLWGSPEVPGTDGFDAFGKPVSTERQVSALDCAVENLGVDAMMADPVIQVAAGHVERDDPYAALTVLMNIVDLTGAYRLLAVMCTGGG